ncbi:MAG: hypothetical protein R3348_02480 [Xanthomonadales bacterium]|nr:hypothetical protein [Xanthomonadales bacterium]
MHITAELSLYPLDREYIPLIKRFIGALQSHTNLDIVVNQMSTQVSGDFSAVTGAINQAMRECLSGPERAALVVKYLNTSLPIATAPDLD